MRLFPALAVACLLSTPALAADELSACRDPANQGLRQRMENIRDQMDRAEYAATRDEQRRILELHSKTMQEGMREMRRRDPAPACREQLMYAMMEQMVRHQLAAQSTSE
jgi:hypothetical protein